LKNVYPPVPLGDCPALTARPVSGIFPEEYVVTFRNPVIWYFDKV
jgi:hypothetical protein